MCGILGIYRRGGLKAGRDESGLVRGLAGMARRGPDGEGIWRDSRLLIGHRRLAILDPAHGRQPMEDEATGVVISYNGEIYNYASLRESLETEGVVFRTRCDTEAVLQAYLRWGGDFVDRLEGMFALALYDPREERLLLARDRLGVKPLYVFHEDRRYLAFSSSVAALLGLDEVAPVLDPVALAHYFLTVRNTLGDRTLIRGVSGVPPGEVWELRLGDGTLHKRRYWTIPVLPAKDKEPVSGFSELAAGIAGELDDAVRRQLISDVPVGVFLSGGVDSSVLAAAIAADPGQRYHACSVGYRMDGYNEWSHARTAAARHGLDCREVVLNGEDYLDDWQALLRFKGLPLSTPNEVPIFRLAGVFRETCTVAMTGEGADEIFGGYVGPTFCAIDFDRAGSNPSPAFQEALRREYGTDSFSCRREHFFRVNAWLDPARQRGMLRDGGSWVDGPLQAVMENYDSLFAALEPCTTLDAYLQVHARVNLEGLLNRLDSSTMAASVEGRVPFTDHRLVEQLFRMPDSVRMALRPAASRPQREQLTSFELARLGLVESKRLLREGYAGRVDADILKREKMSFPVPFLQWFGSSWRGAYRAALNESPLLRDLLAPSFIAGAARPGRPVDGMRAWPLMNLALMEKAWGIRL